MSEPFISYAQNGEDIILWRVLRHVERGYYVDVGAADPVGYSATYAFYQRGWYGLNLEPVLEFAAALRSVRPRDTTLQIAAGDRDGEFTAYVVEGTGLSTMDPDRAEELRTSGFDVRADTVPVRTLTSILDNHVESSQPIHVLKVDVEGFERQVLLGLDLERWRPWVLVIESTRPMSTEQSHHEWESLVTDRGYVYCMFDGLNRYYLAAEHAELQDRLDHGPSIFDRPYQLADVTLGIERHREHLVLELQQAHEAARTASERAVAADAARTVAEAERAATAQRVQELTTALSNAELAGARFQLSLSELQRAHDHLRLDHDELRVEHDRLIAQHGSLVEEYDTAVSHLEGHSATTTELAAVRAEYEALCREHDFRGQQLQALYDSETWRIGRAVWHIGRRTRLDKLGRRPMGKALDRAFGRPPVIEERVAVEPAVVTDTVWNFPGRAEWHGPLTDLADALVRASLPAAADIRSLTDALDADRSTALLERTFTAREREAINDLVLSTNGRVRRATVDGKVVIDARCFDDPGLRARGVGRHATDVLRRLGPVLATFADVVVLRADEEVSEVEALEGLGRVVPVDRYGPHEAPPELFISLSPSTAAIVPQCVGTRTRAIALAFDLIPYSFARHYHGDPVSFLQYCSTLSWMRTFDELWCISAATAGELVERLGIDPSRTRVTGVNSPVPAGQQASSPRAPGPALRLLLCGGGDVRKNMLTPLLAAVHLGAIAEIEILGTLPDDMRQPLLDAARGSAVAVRQLSELGDAEVAAAFSRCDAVLVPSRAEGFSMPAAEGVIAGRAVVASRIPAHEELLGDGPWLVDADDVGGWAAALGQVRDSDAQRAWATRQAEQFARGVSARWDVETAHLRAPGEVQRSLASRRPTLAVVTPLPPQRSGIADYSAFTLPALGKHFDLSFVANSIDEVSSDVGPVRGRTIETVTRGEFDHVIHVLGNSHFHIPALELLGRFGGGAIAHDNRMSGVYQWWRGSAETARIMSMHGATVHADEVAGYLIDLDGAPDTCYGEIIEQAEPLFVHSTLLARMIKAESGRDVVQLPFCPYRLPVGTPGSNRPGGRRTVVTFGEISIALKRHDLVVEMLAWLRQWGEDVELVVVGAGTELEVTTLEEMANDAGVGDRFTITGRVDEAGYRHWLAEADAAVQVRNTALLSLSGAILDAIAFGVPLVVTQSAAEELPDAPNVVAVPNHFSSMQLASAVSSALQLSRTGDAEQRRTDFLANRSPDVYASLIADALLEKS